MNAHPASPETRYYAFIDGLRALAIISVICFHFQESLIPGGYLGVDIFFVLSGFVVTGSLTGYRSETISG